MNIPSWKPSHIPSQAGGMIVPWRVSIRKFAKTLVHSGSTINLHSYGSGQPWINKPSGNPLKYRSVLGRQDPRYPCIFYLLYETILHPQNLTTARPWIAMMIGRLHPWSLTASLPLKNGGKGRKTSSFPIGVSGTFQGRLLFNFRGEMFNFRGVPLLDLHCSDLWCGWLFGEPPLASEPLGGEKQLLMLQKSGDYQLGCIETLLNNGINR